jgi:hypothetical protein
LDDRLEGAFGCRNILWMASVVILWRLLSE